MAEADDMNAAIAWMKANSAGYKRAAKEFSIDPDALRAHARARGQLVTLPQPTPRAEPTTLDAYLVDLDRALASDITAARADERWSDVAKLVAAQVKARHDLAELRARDARAAVPEDEAPEDRLRRELADVEDAIAQQRARPRQDGAAVAALMRRRSLIHAEIDAVRAAAVVLPTDPDELREIVAEIVDQWPDDLLERAFMVYSDRHRATLELVRDDGRRVRYTAAGWVKS